LGDSLWNARTSSSIISVHRARAVGDILTVLVQENNTATKENKTSTAKSSSVDASIASFLYSPAASGLLTKGGKLPAMKMSGANNFDGGGKINNSETITANIAVRVIDVLPNGNLVIEGSRKTSFSGETQEAVLRGVIRFDDIQANNTVYSYNIADATIKYVSNGAVTDSQKKSWFTKVWDKVSPF
jgi:flagellar L-ring protein precursor FlgH